MRVARLEPPDRVARAWPLPVLRRTAFAPLAALLIVLGAVVPGPAAAATTWSRNLFVSSAFVYQDPYYTACTAASTMIMLNTIAARGSGGPGFAWTPYRVKSSPDPADLRDMLSILAFERANDTLRATSPGTDAHGWRNALNYYGWGELAMTDPSQMVYVDRAYKSFAGAVRTAVKAIARRNMPVGILGWAGGHAQVMTGYIVTGANPEFSDDFTVRYVFLSDPLKKDRMVNRRLSYERLRTGALKYRFQRYRETDSPYDDPYTAGFHRSSVSSKRGPSEWYHRWVIVVPVRSGIVLPPPSPTPPPDESSASADPSASLDPAPSADATTADTSMTANASPSADAGVLLETSGTTSTSTLIDPTPGPTVGDPTPTPAPASLPPPDPTPTPAPSAVEASASPPAG